MRRKNSLPVLVFFIPIFLGLLFALYYKENRRALTNRLVDSGVMALFEDGIVTIQDIRDYFFAPPAWENSILSSLELTPEDVSGLENEDPEWMRSVMGQRLILRVIKHLALVKYLNQQPEAKKIESIEQEVKRYKENLMIERMEEDLARVTPTITKEEMLNYYVNNPSQFHQEGRRLARHIMLYENETSSNPNDPFQPTPQNMLTLLQNGEDFPSLIQRFQLETTNSEGLLGWLPQGVLSKEFDNIIWSMEVGEIRGPIESGSAYHFFHLIDEQPEGLMPFEECQDQIREILEEEKKSLNRYRFLDLPESIALSPDPDSTQEYRDALLEAAYAREWGKNIDIVKKVEAYREYRRAETVFDQYVSRLRDIHQIPQETETMMVLEIECADRLLNKMDFRLLIKLNTLSDNFNPPDNSLP